MILIYCVLANCNKIIDAHRNTKWVTGKEMSKIKKTRSISDDNKKLSLLTDDLAGVINVKTSNITGYDLYYPNGTYKWTKDVKSQFMCNGKYFSAPLGRKAKEFDLFGFIFVSLGGLLLTLITSSTYPMLITIKAQTSYLVNTMDMIKGFLFMGQRREGERKIKLSDVLSYAWLAIGVLLTMFASIFIANSFFALNGWRNMYRLKILDECYALGFDNLEYNGTNRTLSDDQTPATIRARVKIETNDTVIFVTNCDAAFYQPDDLSVKWEISTAIQPYCDHVKAYQIHQMQMQFAYGCPGGDGQVDPGVPKEFTKDKFKIYDSYIKKCVKNAVGCCQPCFTCNQWKCGKPYIQYEELNLKNCTPHYVGVKITRNGVDVTEQYLETAIVKDPREQFNYGWLENEDDGTKPIFLPLPEGYIDGRKFSTYIGGNFEEWIKNDVVRGEDANNLNFAELRDLETPKIPGECQQILFLNKEAKKLDEFSHYCKLVHAYQLDRSGNYKFTTNDEKACLVPIRITVGSGETYETSISLSKNLPVQQWGVLDWKCKTDKENNNSIGTDCSNSLNYNQFVPDSIKEDYSSQIVPPGLYNPPPSDEGIKGIDLDGLLGKFNIKDTLIAVGCVIGGIILIIVVLKLVVFIITKIKFRKNKQDLNLAV